MPNNQTSQAEPFTTMASQIEAINSATFGGAFVVVLPSGEHLSSLLLDTSQDDGSLLLLLNASVNNYLSKTTKPPQTRRTW